MGKRGQYLEEKMKDPEYRRHYNQEGVQIKFWEGLLEHLIEQGRTEEDLATLSGFGLERIKKCEAGDDDLTLREASDLCFAIGCRMQVQIVKD